MLNEYEAKFPKLQNFFLKRIISDIPVSPEHGRGVKSLTDLQNPATGRRYGQEEIKNLPETKKQELYNQCRYVKFDIVKPTRADKNEQYTELIKKISGFPIVRFLLDRSGSMSEELSRLGNKMAEQLVGKGDFADPNKDKAVVTFSGGIDFQTGNYVRIRSQEDIRKYIENIYAEGGGEQQMKAASQMIDQLDKEFVASKKRQAAAVVVLSDEGVNDFDLARLQELVKKAEKSKVTVFFAMINDWTKLITTVDAKGLVQEFNDFIGRLDNAYYPADSMSTKDKEKFILEQIKTAQEIQHIDDDNRRGAQVDINGNVYFALLLKELKVNIEKRYKAETDEKEKKKLVKLYRVLE